MRLMSTKKLKALYRISETEKTYIFTNKFNVHIELDKETGAYVDGNIKDNDQTRPLFKKLFHMIDLRDHKGRLATAVKVNTTDLK